MEKPISVDHKTAQAFVELTKQFPKQKVVVGFSRRCELQPVAANLTSVDESYRSAKDYIHKGLLGNAYMVKSTTQDLYDPSGFFVAYSKFSGGIWMDCGIHDIDMARWLLDIKPENRVKRVMASGTNVRHPELVNDGDADNAMAFIEYEDGQSITFHVGRTAMHGHEVSCEVYGTEGKLVVNQVSCPLSRRR
jgi:myo-inositol 2-dehydrogenase/D-chiro-inositol 1-dehydrogenase